MTRREAAAKLVAMAATASIKVFMLNWEWRISSDRPHGRQIRSSLIPESPSPYVSPLNEILRPRCPGFTSCEVWEVLPRMAAN